MESSRRSILLILMAVAYFSATYGSTLSFVFPPVGSGVPILKRANGHPMQAPRPSWTPRRHLPLVKYISLDHLSPIAREFASDRHLSSIRVLPRTSLCRDRHFASPSLGRAPPLA